MTTDPSWLDEPGNERLAAGLANARERVGDDFARTRVWKVLAEPDLFMADDVARRARQRRWPVLAMGLSALGLCGLLVFVLSPKGTEPPQIPALAAAPVLVAAPVAEAPVQFLSAPAIVKTGPDETMGFRLEGGAHVLLTKQAHLTLPENRQPELHAGRASLQVPPQPAGQTFAVQAGPYRVVVIGTRFAVQVSVTDVSVDVDEGTVEVWRGDRVVRLRAGQSWTGPVVESELLAPAPVVEAAEIARQPLVRRSQGQAAVSAALPQVTTPETVAEAIAAPSAADLSAEVRGALNAGQPERALQLLGVLARNGGAAGENALYEMGRILRVHMAQPHRALEIWRQYRATHPRGLLRAEVDLSLVETYVATGQNVPALNEARDFLARYPASERRGEVEALIEDLAGR